MDALRMPSPGGAVILSLRTARSVYAGGGVEEEGRRLRRSSCEPEEEGAYAGGSIIVVVTGAIIFFSPLFLSMSLFADERVWFVGSVMRGTTHDERNIYIRVG